MIEVNENTDRGVLALKASGKLTKKDLDELVPSLKRHIAESDDPHLLMIMEDFQGWADAAAVWKDLQLDAEYIGYFDRIAIVGEKKWQEWGTRLMDPVIKEEMKFFPSIRSRMRGNGSKKIIKFTDFDPLLFSLQKIRERDIVHDDCV